MAYLYAIDRKCHHIVQAQHRYFEHLGITYTRRLTPWMAGDPVSFST